MELLRYRGWQDCTPAFLAWLKQEAPRRLQLPADSDGDLVLMTSPRDRDSFWVIFRPRTPRRAA